MNTKTKVVELVTVTMHFRRNGVKIGSRTFDINNVSGKLGISGYTHNDFTLTAVGVDGKKYRPRGIRVVNGKLIIDNEGK